MFYLYCLPGRLFAQIGYLWPGRGQLWASRRRHDSRFAHFFYATIIWGVILWLFVFPHFAGQPSAQSRENQNSAPPSAPSSVTTGNDTRGELLPNAEDTIQRVEGAVPAAPLRAIHPGADDARALARRSGKADEPEQVSNLLAIDAVKEAMHRAFVSGKAERWRRGKLSGYAVPSELVVAGCRAMAVSNDKDQKGAVQTKICG